MKIPCGMFLTQETKNFPNCKNFESDLPSLTLVPTKTSSVMSWIGTHLAWLFKKFEYLNWSNSSKIQEPMTCFLKQRHCAKSWLIEPFYFLFTNFDFSNLGLLHEMQNCSMKLKLPKNGSIQYLKQIHEENCQFHQR